MRRILLVSIFISFIAAPAAADNWMSRMWPFGQKKEASEAAAMQRPRLMGSSDGRRRVGEGPSMPRAYGAPIAEPSRPNPFRKIGYRTRTMFRNIGDALTPDFNWMQRKNRPPQTPGEFLFEQPRLDP